jgi:hypothetical protein
MRAPLAASALGTLVFLATAVARAADPAQEAFDRGVAQMEAGRFDLGCPAVEQSYKLDPRPGTLFTLAECEAKRGHLTTAVKRYDDYLALWAALPHDKKQKQAARAQTARLQRATLLPLIPTLTLVLPPTAPASTLVTLDGATLSPAAIGVPTPVDPGEHIVTTQAGSGPVTRVGVSLDGGEKRSVVLEVREVDAQQADAAASAPSWQRPAGIAAAGAGAVLLGVGVGFGVHAFALGSDARAACGGHVCAPASPGVQLFEDGNSAANVADGTLLAGGVLAAGGAVLLILSARSAPGAPAGSGRVEVIPAAGPGLAAITVRGAW